MPSTLPPPPPSHHHLPSTAKTPSSPLPSSSNSRPDSQAQWARLLEQYANGEAALDRLVVDPPFDLLEPATEEDERIVETAEKGSAEYCRSFYRREGYLPAPANPREEERQQTLHRYGLHRSAFRKLSAVKNLADLARSIFGVDSCIVTVVLEDTVQFVAAAGSAEDDSESNAAAACNSWDASYCPHSISKTAEQGPFVVRDALEDFRFARAPIVKNDGMRFFASANINLPSPGRHELFPVGSFCLLSSSPRDNLTEGEKQTLSRFSDLCAKELELVYQREQTKLAQGRQDYISNLFKSLLVYSSRSLTTTKDRCTVDEVAREIVRHTRSDFGFLLDCRSLNYVTTSGTSQTRSSRLDPLVHGNGSLSCLTMWCGDDKAGPEWDNARVDYLANLEGEGGLQPVVDALNAWHKNQRTSFSRLDDQNRVAMSPLLPVGTTAALVAPIFDHEGEPALLVVTGSYEPFKVFEEVDERFVESAGSIALTSLQKDKILAADRAKLSFVSQVSHELRTPLHSVRGVLDLVREISTPDALRPISSLLDVGDSSIQTLHDILEDCLEHAKLSNHNTLETMPAPRVADCAISGLVVEVMKSCASRAKQAARIKEEEGIVREDVGLFFESQLPPDLIAKVDVGGLKRVVINLVGNSIKFTEAGSVTVRVSEVFSSSQRMFRIEVIDTGCGIDQDFLQNDLFTAFRQVNAFGVGAGLGVSLSAQLIRRMKGTIGFTSTVGVGTTCTVTLPLDVVESSPPSSATRSPSATRIVISDLLACASPVPSPSTTPFSSPSPTSKGTPSPSTFSSLPPSPPLEAPTPPILSRSNTKSDTITSALKVLVVDDNPIALKVLTMWLKTKKYAYAEAKGGADAIELFKSFRPNLVWCDIQMPDVDGIEATKAMRAYEDEQGLPRSRIIALSGLDANLGENGHVLKNGQVDRWIVKGGPSLKTLSLDMLEHEKTLTQSAASSDSGYYEAPPIQTGLHGLVNGVSSMKV